MYIQEADQVALVKQQQDLMLTKDAIVKYLGTKIESCSNNLKGICKNISYHPFVNAVNDCYDMHRPLVLSPDMFWLLITQGFAAHLELHAEDMREQFVDHEGQKEIVVRRDDFIKGIQNPWDNTFTEFSEYIKNDIGQENHENIVVGFSTTGEVEKAANEVVLMDAMKDYYRYTCVTRCGIPSVELEGEISDWVKLRDKAEDLGKAYKLQWWTDYVHPQLDRIVNNVSGKDDPGLWTNFFKTDFGSGGPFINGWINVLFPYLSVYDRTQSKRVNIKNPHINNHEDSRLTSSNFSSGLSTVPFLWKYYKSKFNMEFIVGFVGVAQVGNSNRPEIGWAVREAQQ